MKFILGLLFILQTTFVFAHSDQLFMSNDLSIISIKNLTNFVRIQETKTHIHIISNGIPIHRTGVFPGRGNPHSISEQRHDLKVSKNPQTNMETTQSRFFGVALNGVMFVPGTAECWGKKRGGRSQRGLGSQPFTRKPPRPRSPRNMDDCEWREEAIVNGSSRLGLDDNFAHVQPSGMYHYHGRPEGLIKRLNQKTNKDLLLVGYAGDGFKIYVSQGNKYSSSYRLKSGTRRTGPSGVYDGTYTADYKFISDAGELDECNGLTINDGTYAYIITKEFPFVPRCWRGLPDRTFIDRPDGR